MYQNSYALFFLFFWSKSGRENQRRCFKWLNDWNIEKVDQNKKENKVNKTVST